MEIIRTYTNTKCELEIAEARLNLLKDKKEQLYCKYFPVTRKIKDDTVSGGKEDNGKMAGYVHELNEVDAGSGYSLAKEIEHQKDLISKTKSYLKTMDETLSRLRGIEYALYYEIVVEGVGISKAVGKIAERYCIDDRTVWKYHYKKIKKDIIKLKSTVKVQ